jgi:hypothetical protein
LVSAWHLLALPIPIGAKVRSTAAVLLVGFVFASLTGEAQAADAPAPGPSASAAAGNSDPCTTTLAIVARPTVTTGACTVKRGHATVETGYQNTIAAGSAPVAQYPQTTIRVGTSVPNLEVSVALPNFLRSAGSTASADTAFGAKYEVGYSSRWLYGVNALVSVPTGLNGGSNNGTDYSADADVTFVLTPGVSLSGTVGYNSLSNADQHYTSLVPSFLISGSLSPAAAIFGEIAQFSHAAGPGSPTRTQYLVGVQQSFANRVQIDVEAGRSPTASTGAYHYLGAGLSYYF